MQSKKPWRSAGFLELRARALLVAFVGAAAAVFACGADESPDPVAISAEAGVDGATGDASGDGSSTVNSDAGGDAGTPKPEAGTYMGACAGKDGFTCAPGLTCEQFAESSLDGGFKSCGQRICTHPCDAGCPAPSVGCENGKCAPVSCL